MAEIGGATQVFVQDYAAYPIQFIFKTPYMLTVYSKNLHGALCTIRLVAHYQISCQKWVAA